MTIVLDIGNTQIKWAVVGANRKLFRLGSAGHEARLPAKAVEQWSELPPPESVLAVSVAGDSLREELVTWMDEHWGVCPRFLSTPYVGGGITVAYENPAALGVDRWVAMAGACGLGLLPACIVDCGTAITVDTVDAAGAHRGGVIAPGLGTMRRSLFERAHQLPSVTSGTVHALATDTSNGIHSGTVLAAAGAINRIASLQVGKLQTDEVTCIITGGDAPAILPWLTGQWHHVPDLILQGLAWMEEKSS